jgi:hypothetical protein
VRLPGNLLICAPTPIAEKSFGVRLTHGRKNDRPFSIWSPHCGSRPKAEQVSELQPQANKRAQAQRQAAAAAATHQSWLDYQFGKDGLNAPGPGI